MGKYTLIYEQEYEYDDFQEKVYPAKKTVVEISQEDVAWDTLLEEFFVFLNATGYLISPELIPQMVEMASEYHKRNIFGGKFAKIAGEI